jgi:hypothetical protein
MEKATEAELYQLAGYARMHDLPLALKWLMRAMQEKQTRPRRRVRVRLKGGGEFWMAGERLKER